MMILRLRQHIHFIKINLILFYLKKKKSKNIII